MAPCLSWPQDVICYLRNNKVLCTDAAEQALSATGRQGQAWREMLHPLSGFFRSGCPFAFLNRLLEEGGGVVCLIYVGCHDRG